MKSTHPETRVNEKNGRFNILMPRIMKNTVGGLGTCIASIAFTDWVAPSPESDAPCAYKGGKSNAVFAVGLL